MKLALSLGYSGARLDIPTQRILLAERLGFHSVWTAEAYGSDAITPLAYLAGKTTKIKLGTAVIQVAARSAAAAAMAIGTLDSLAGGGRTICGVGVSGPQIVEGWYGEPWGKPYHRIKDYVNIMRKVFERNEPVTHDGREISLPFIGEGSTGLGKPLRSILHIDPDLPIWLGTGSETNVKLTGEIADGWLPLNFVPGSMETFQPWLEIGLARRADGRTLKDLDIFARVPVKITGEIRQTLASYKPNIALYVGGMGHRHKNFHKDAMILRGYSETAQNVQDLYLAGRKTEAAEAIPDEYVDEMCLVGPKDRIKNRYLPWKASGATGLLVITDQEEAIDLMASLSKED